MPLLRTLLLALALALLAAVPARALPAPADTTALLSGAPDLLTPLPTPVADSTSGPQALDNLAAHVAFSSRADGLAQGDDDDVQNVYVKTISDGTITLVSRADGIDGEPAHADCGEAVISLDGTRAAFTCEGPLDSADTNGQRDVYVRDLRTGRTELVSRLSGRGAVADGRSDRPAIDGTGSHVAFVSNAGNLAGTPGTPAGSRVYRRRVGSGDQVLPVGVPDGLLRASNPVATDVDAISISATGDVIAFDTEQDFDPTRRDGNGLRDVYARRVISATTFLVSRADGATGAVGDGASSNPRVDADGDMIAFDSTAANFVHATDATTDLDVYRRDVDSSATQLISATAGGVKANAEATVGGISSDGAAVAFVTAATNLDPADTVPGADVYVNSAFEIVLASRADRPDGAPANAARFAAISGDGDRVATAIGGVRGTTPARVELRVLPFKTTLPVSRPAGDAPFENQGGDGAAGPLSGDGRFAVFFSTAPALGADPAGDGALFVRDSDSGAVTLVSRADGPDGAPLTGTPTDAAITPDGRFVAFLLDPGGRFALAPAFRTLWLRDRQTGRTTLVGRADGPDGAPANADAFSPSVSDDGGRVAFATTATNLGDGDTTDDSDVHVRDVASGRTVLASRTSGSGPTPPRGDGDATIGAVSGDGRSVGFSSTATNLGDGDADTLEDVFVRRLDTNVTRLVSRADNGAKADAHARFAAIDRDGDRIALVTGATNFPARDETVYVRDLAANRLLLAGRADGADGAPLAGGRVSDARLSADGRRVAFEASSPRPLALGAPTDEGLRVYLRDLAAGSTRLISRGNGAAGAPARFAQLGGIAADGGCVSFTAFPRVFGIGTSDDYAHAFLRTVDDACGATAAGGGETPPGGDDGDGGGAGGGDGDRGPARDRTAPRISGVRLSSKKIRTSGRGTRSTTLSFRTTERGRLTVTIAQEVAGRSGARNRCLQAGERVRRGRRCTALKPVATLRRTIARAGAGRLRLTAKLGRRTLAPGRYRLTLVVRDAAGNASKPAVVRLTVTR